MLSTYFDGLSRVLLNAIEFYVVLKADKLTKKLKETNVCMYLKNKIY
jgi:hypothetical protein